MVTKSSEKVTSVCIKYPNKSFYWGEKIIKFGHPKILKKTFFVLTKHGIQKFLNLQIPSQVSVNL